MDSIDSAQQAEPNRAIRLLIEYDRSGFSISKSWHIETLAPASHSLETRLNASGFWIELRDGSDKLLYRRVLHDPAPVDVEVFDPDRGLRRVALDEPKGVFTVLVPDLPDAEEIAIVSSPIDLRKRESTARQVARLPLPGRKRRRG
jgi:hypothetical protein